jgi:hypothetical protein
MRNGSKRRQRLIGLVTVLVTVLVVAGTGRDGELGTARAAGKASKIRMATLAPKGSSFHQSLQMMGQKWRGHPTVGPLLRSTPTGPWAVSLT